MADAITTAVANVMSNGTDYTASGDTTHCSEFVRDFWNQLQFAPTPVLAGQANDQVKALLASSAWNNFPLGGASDNDLQEAFNNADSAASSGKVVLVGWLNPDWTGP